MNPSRDAANAYHRAWRKKHREAAGILPAARMRDCSVCGQPFFGRAANAIRCKKAECQRQRSRQYRRDLWSRDRAGVLTKVTKWRATALQSILLTSAKQRAKRLGLPFAITPSDVPMPDICPVLGIEIRKGEVTTHEGSPSLDRIVPSLGYVPGNVRVISHRANRIKADATEEEIAAVLRYIREAKCQTKDAV